MKVKDIMETNVITVPPDKPVKEVARLLAEHDVTAVPVVDDHGKILGIVSEEDLIYRLAHPCLPPHIELLGGVIYLENPFEMRQEFKKLTAITAGEIMTDKVLTVTGDAEIEDVATMMIENDINGIPVVKEGKITGIITRHDIVMTLARSEPGEKEEDDEEDKDEDTGDESAGESEDEDTGDESAGESEDEDTGDESAGEKEEKDTGDESAGEKEEKDTGDE